MPQCAQQIDTLRSEQAQAPRCPSSRPLLSDSVNSTHMPAAHADTAYCFVIRARYLSLPLHERCERPLLMGARR
eukprot:2064780-Prymnesium_polylepis.1